MKTHPFIHVAMAISVFFSFSAENWSAAVAWAIAWSLCVVHDIAITKLLKTLMVTKLFVDAYGGKWPNKKAEDEAAKALAEFMKDQGGQR